MTNMTREGVEKMILGGMGRLAPHVGVDVIGPLTFGCRARFQASADGVDWFFGWYELKDGKCSVDYPGALEQAVRAQGVFD